MAKPKQLNPQNTEAVPKREVSILDTLTEFSSMVQMMQNCTKQSHETK